MITRTRMLSTALASFCSLSILGFGAAGGYESLTHAEIAVRAAQPGVSRLDDILKIELSLAQGAKQVILELPIERHLGEGAADEDAPYRRSLNHFHDPLLPWEAAGLTIGGTQVGQSSVLWQQNDAQPEFRVGAPVAVAAGGGLWSWRNTRDHYVRALTSEQRRDRDRAFADTFRGLGHLTHLIQDASVPAHARNDAHLVFEGYEAWVDAMRRGGQNRDGRSRRVIFDRLLGRPPINPVDEILQPGLGAAPVPIARLIDADVFDGLSPVGLTGRRQGLAEYANGNFVSDDTIFQDFTLPRRESLDPVGFLAPEGSAQRRFFSKMGEGEPVPHFLAEGALHERLRFRGVPQQILTDRVYEDYAGLLLPRAVGYSAALLDYFFRGRLDVRLADDGGARMVGTNASAEPLGDGTLAVYAETPDGTRTLAGSTAVGPVAPGGVLPDVRVTAPEGAERFVAVYQGTLGDEVAVGQFRGALAGKVFSGVRVEEVFTDGASWQLRTPDRAVALPFALNDYVDVRWAEGENFLIARTPFGIDLPNEVVVFEVLRAPDSIAPLTSPTPEGERVQVVERERVRIPLDLSVGTTVELQQTIRYRQQLGRFERTVTFTAVECGDPPRFICYNATGEDIGPVIFDNVVDVSVPFTVTIPLVLDAAHNVALSPDGDFAFEPTPYFWDLVEVRRDRAGRLLGLVRVTVTQPGRTVPSVSVPYYEVDRAGALTPVRQLGLAPFFPSQLSPLWVLVDLTQGQILGSTAGPRVVVTSAATQEGEPWGRLGINPREAAVWSRDVRVFVGGETPGTETTDWVRVPLGPPSPSPSARVGGISDLQVQLGRGGSFLDPASSDALAADQLRPELAMALGPLLAPAVTTAATSWDLGYACHIFSGLCSVVRVQQTVKDLTPSGVLREARLAGAAERLVLLASQRQGTAATETLAVWDRAAAGARLLVAPVTGFYALDAVATAGALATLFSASDSSVVSGSILSLDPARPSATVAGQDLGGAFALLEPSYLYGVRALKFFETTPALEATTLPAALAPVAGNPVGDYHVISVR